MRDKYPWEVNPQLQKERLVFLARLISEVRHGVVEHAEPDLGDGGWVVGVTAHSRIGRAICREAESGKHEWLEVYDPSLRFIVGIGGVPLRIYRGDETKPSRTSKKRSRLELVKQIEFFEKEEMGVAADAEWLWRMCVVTDEMGEAIRIVMLQIGPGGDVRYPYEIPFKDPVAGVSEVTPMQPEGKQLSKPLVAPKPPPMRETGTDEESGGDNNTGESDTNEDAD